MKKIAFLMLIGAALFATAGAASAQYYYPGPGYGVYIGPRYDPDYYPPPPRYYRRDPDRYYGYNQRPRYYRSGPGGCPYGYTVQDGVCKPYRGY